MELLNRLWRNLIAPALRLWRLSSLAVLPRRRPREGACEKIELAAFGKTSQRHSREGGNPFIKLEQALIWVPAFAGTTLRPGFQPGRRFLRTLLRGNDGGATSEGSEFFFSCRSAHGTTPTAVVLDWNPPVNNA